MIDELQSARLLLKRGQTGLFICTDGLNLQIDELNGTGSSGWWVLNPKRHVDRVFVFRQGKDGSSPNEVFSGRRVKSEALDDGRRYRLHLIDVRRDGNTQGRRTLISAYF